MSETQVVIDVHGLRKSFAGKTVVNNLSLSVERGEIYGFLGPNGSGKTTSLRMLCGLLQPDAGEGICLGHDLLREVEQVKFKVGYMAQRFSLYEDLSVQENLDFSGRIYAIPARRKAVKQIMERMGLIPYADQLSGTLSGGWKQRLALASCLLHQPELLLLDEPTAGVDPKARLDFWEEIYRLSGQGISALISTHYMEEAERCHRVAYLADGQLLTSGTASEVIDSAGLVTWEVSGPQLQKLAVQLRGCTDIEQVIPFGNTLHVCGHDADLLKAALQPFLNDSAYRWQPTETRLEEVFIALMGRHREEQG